LPAAPDAPAAARVLHKVVAAFSGPGRAAARGMSVTVSVGTGFTRNTAAMRPR
jgi:hypothetical protein